jgi:hypothetical protein
MSSEIVAGIRRKLKKEEIKVATIISRCERIDRNNDAVIHIEDLEDVFHGVCGPTTFSRRELNQLFNFLAYDKKRGSVQYRRLEDVLGEKEQAKEQEEHWFDEDEEGGRARFPLAAGTLGDFMTNIACPSEVRNFKRLIAALERYERDSGMRVKTTEDGFQIPLGPELRATMKFTS